MKTLYAVPFWDVSTPSFVSFSIEYFGTDEDIAEFAAACRRSDSHEEFLRGYDELQNGNTEATINIAYRDMPIQDPVELLGTSECISTGLCWETLNTWDCVYKFNTTQLSRELIWIKYNDSFIRAAKYTIKGLTIGEEGERQTVANRWGNDEVISFEEGSCTDCHSLFYFPERYFDSEEECLDDMASPDFRAADDLRALCFEFLGDG